jgi:hypothetical protein
MASSGMLRLVALVRTDVVEERINHEGENNQLARKRVTFL